MKMMAVKQKPLSNLHWIILVTLLWSAWIGVSAPAQAHAAPTANEAVVPAPLPGSGDHFYKLTVTTTGIQAVTYAALAAAGLPVATIDPATFQIFEQGEEIARQVVDADHNTTFSVGDYLLFYGRAIDTYFSGVNIYWLTYGVQPGLEMAQRDVTPQPGLPAATTFQETLHLEQNTRWMKAIPLEGNADRWYWKLYQPVCAPTCQDAQFAVDVAVTGIATGAHTATLTPRVRGFNDRSHIAIFAINGVGIGQANFAYKNEFTGSFTFDQALLNEGANTINLTAPYDGLVPSDMGLVNWYELQYARTYVAPTTGQFAFAVDASSPSAVTLTGVADGAAIYDITDPRHPQALTGVQPALIASVNLAFAHTLNAPARYIAAAPGQALAPTSITLDAPSALRNPAAGADWIIISHANFLTEAQRLAAHRQATREFRTAVVDVQDVYDEFGGGVMDQEAIRAFLRYAYENWPLPAPRYAVLLGDGHYDPRNYRGLNAPYFIPPYLGPFDPLEGITAGDNRYVAYDPVLPIINPMPFMHLGRLPANTLADATAMVDKIIAYELTSAHADWNQDVVFAADNADTAGDFADHSNQVADSTYYLPATYDREKIYYLVNQPTSTAANNALVAAINRGALFVNYNGHASAAQWTGETPPIIKTADLSRLTNAGRYPVMLPMTCLEGQYIDLSTASFGESVVRLPNAGAVASWSPTGKGVASGHQTLWNAFYEAVFQKGMTELGPATDYGKQALFDTTRPFKDLIDTYVLFGDPAMTLDLPAPDLWVQKQASPDAPWQPGQAITYVLTYGNSGSASATTLHITDTLPIALHNAGWTASDPALTAIGGSAFTWQLPALAPGAGGVITVTATVALDVADGATIVNNASISSAAAERYSDRANNNSQTTHGVEAVLYAAEGLTFEDTNSDGIYDPITDTPLAGVLITIRDAANVIVATTQSGQNGQWQVWLPAGAYTVVAPINAGGRVISSDATQPITLPSIPGSVVNFGYAAPTGLGIEYARAAWRVNGVRVSWATKEELSVQQFNVYRSSSLSDLGKKLNTEPILPKAPLGEGATYLWDDLDARPGTPIYYWIQVITDSGPVVIGPLTPTWATRVRLPVVLK